MLSERYISLTLLFAESLSACADVTFLRFLELVIRQ